jgi:hypothetical protein
MRQNSPDAPRKTLEQVTTPFFVGFFFVMMILSGACTLYGMLGGLETFANSKIDKHLLFFLIGCGGFLFSFPTMVSLYVAQVVLARLRDLERRN